MRAVSKGLAARVDALRTQNAERDRAMQELQAVREGKAGDFWPELFTDEWDRPIVANFIDTAAHDAADMVSGLPTLQCSASKNTSGAERKAEKKNKIGRAYWDAGNLERQMKQYGGEYFVTYGFMPIFVEVDWKNKTPYPQIEDSRGVYYRLDRRGRCVEIARVWKETLADICAMFPDDADAIREEMRAASDRLEMPSDASEWELVRYSDTMNTVLYMPAANDTVLASYANPVPGRCPAAIAETVRFGKRPRGAYEDVVMIYLARARFALFGLDAAYESIHAPLALPNDVNEAEIGPNATFTSDSPEKIRRVDLHVPPEVFQQQALLDNEQRVGGRYPEARTGNIDASVVTGQGVNALMAGFNSQIATAQQLLGFALSEITELCFLYDVALFGRITKEINGKSNGETYRLSYTPRVDIGEETSCAVTYGFQTGLSPAQSVVMMLQLGGARVISTDTMQRMLPWEIDPQAEQTKINVEQTREALKQALFAYLQAAPQLIAAGQDPGPAFQKAAQGIKDLQAGKPIEEIIEAMFAPKEPSPEELAAQAVASGGAPGAAGPAAGGGGEIPGVGSDFLPPGVAPGQAGSAPGGMPSVMDLVASMRGGTPQASASVRQRVAAG